ncbi:hypothetical protein, partial [Mesorhizobium sp.]|uniref:hypothetical protein n=1 Tax=Mesorhizobium sp. TaxID=1871066 RepID=UPI00257B8E84
EYSHDAIADEFVHDPITGLDDKPIEQVHEIRRIILRAPDPASLGKSPGGTPPANNAVTFWDADRAE